eukprot:2239213-Prymnesium_polylepis.1
MGASFSGNDTLPKEEKRHIIKSTGCYSTRTGAPSNDETRNFGRHERDSLPTITAAKKGAGHQNQARQTARKGQAHRAKKGGRVTAERGGKSVGPKKGKVPTRPKKAKCHPSPKPKEGNVSPFAQFNSDNATSAPAHGLFRSAESSNCREGSNRVYRPSPVGTRASVRKEKY